MTEGNGRVNIARLDQQMVDVLRRLDRIEQKLDRVIWRVASGSATVALLVSLVVAMIAAAIRG